MNDTNFVAASFTRLRIHLHGLIFVGAARTGKARLNAGLRAEIFEVV